MKYVYKYKDVHMFSIYDWPCNILQYKHAAYPGTGCPNMKRQTLTDNIQKTESVMSELLLFQSCNEWWLFSKREMTQWLKNDSDSNH